MAHGAAEPAEDGAEKFEPSARVAVQHGTCVDRHGVGPGSKAPTPAFAVDCRDDGAWQSRGAASW